MALENLTKAEAEIDADAAAPLLHEIEAALASSSLSAASKLTVLANAASLIAGNNGIKASSLGALFASVHQFNVKFTREN